MIFGRHTHLENQINRDPVHAPQQGANSMATHRTRVCVGYNDDGTPIIKRLSRNNELELNDCVVRTILNSERRREFLPNEPSPINDIPTFEEYAEDWLTTFKQGHIRETTLGGYRINLENHIYPAFGSARINAVTTRMIQKMLNDRSDRSHKTLQDILILLRAILESACSDGLLAKNPANDKRIYIPSDKKTVREALSIDDIRDISKRISLLDKEDDRRYLALLIFTGMRRGEVLGLRWEDLDISSNQIHVCRNVTFPRGCNTPHVGKPKTDSGYRDIPILPDLLLYLEPIGASGYVIGDGITPNTLSIVQRRHERINRTIDLHGATPHVFRHSFATMLYDTGADIKTIQSIMGQSDFKTTADRYCHPRSDRNQAAVSAVQNLIFQ